MNILILSAYDADSHQRWHKGLVRYLQAEYADTADAFNFTVLTLPARFFSWRIRGNALSWALGQRALLESQSWDAILATSMVDLATLKGLMPCLAGIPSCVYFHENQFAYPVTGRSHSSIEPQMVTLYSALAADKVCFNSAYNQQTFLMGLEALLRKLPDQIPPGIVDAIKQKSQVLPVPIEPEYFALADLRDGFLVDGLSGDGLSFKECSRHQSPEQTPHRALIIVWNHRWEYDKCPDLLLAIVQQLAACAAQLNAEFNTERKAKLRIKFHIVGQHFRQIPKAFAELKTLLQANNWLGEWGHLPCAEYKNILAQSDVVLSTAIHDFQGLAVMEAVAAGCTPLLPHRVAYPNFFAQEYLYGTEQEQDNLVLAQDGAAKIMAYCHNFSQLQAPKINTLSWKVLATHYRQLFDALLDCKNNH